MLCNLMYWYKCCANKDTQIARYMNAYTLLLSQFSVSYFFILGLGSGSVGASSLGSRVSDRETGSVGDVPSARSTQWSRHL